MSTMTKRQRVTAALRGEAVDRPPLAFWLHNFATENSARGLADETLRHKKVGEEASELVIASLRGDRRQIAEEAADVLYHLLVLLRAHGMGLADVAEVLRAREGKRRT